MKKKTITGTDLGGCPFCGGKIGASIDAAGSPDGVLHTMPLCETFTALEPQDFISAVLERRAAEASGDPDVRN